MKSLKLSVYLKVFGIILIGIILLIPANMIESLIYERESTQREAISEVSSKWAESQTIMGPFISIPFTKKVRDLSKSDSTISYVLVKDYIHVLPSKLNITCKMIPEKRYRGIYEIVVYNSKINVSGTFITPNYQSAEINLEDIQFDNAFFSVGINDLRGIEKQIDLNWNNSRFNFNPGVVNNDIIASGMNSRITIDSVQKNYVFSFDLDLNGSQLLYFTPVGKETDVKVNSPWSNPSFNGAFLPDNRSINSNGFKADWNILHLNRNYPQSWIGNKYSISESAFGVDLLLPVDNYQKSIRTIKYAILFIVFTFISFFFIEVLNKIFIHPIQYLLVGVSLIVFFTLLLSISEHIEFNLAFIISALSTLILIAGYVKAILKTNILTFLISGILFILYSFIFVIIQLQDFALLIGSIGLFFVLGLVMYFSRKIDWYNLAINEKKSTEIIDNIPRD